MAKEKNDEFILELKKKIQEKKDKLTKVEKFSPVTNLSLQIDGERLNINVLQKEQLLQLWVKLVAYSKAADSIDKKRLLNWWLPN